VPVVLVSIDTLRADRLPAYGYTGVATPQLESLRRDGVVFDNAWSPCPMTLPSHVSMLTGQLPPVHGVRNNVGFRWDARAQPHLPGWLKAQGYVTGAAVSAYVLRAQTGLGAAFDEYDDTLDPRASQAFADQQRPGGQTLRPALRFLATHAARPFFYFLHLYEPHVPYEPPEPFRSRYAHPYDGEIAAADALLGQLVDELRRLGLYERALVIVTSDHGEGLGDHGEEQHSILLYREVLHIPLIVKLPYGRLAGTRVTQPARLTDLWPTLADALGQPAPAGLDGVALLGAGGVSSARTAYAETLYPRLQLGWSDLRSLIDGRWHYIHGPRPELYDLVADPRELHDLAAREPERVAALRAALERVPAGPQQPEGVDREAAERLAALGYVGTLRSVTPSTVLPNPRDMLPSLNGLRDAFHLAAARRFGAAESALRTLVQAQPDLVEAWIKLGDVQLENGRPAEAANAFQEALQRGPGDVPEVRLALGLAYLRAGQPARAVEQAQAVRAAAPARAAELLARVALARGQLDEAQTWARAARDEGGTHPAAGLLLAEVVARRGDLPAALELLQASAANARRLELSHPRGLDFQRGDVLARLGRTREAESCYRQHIEDFPDHLLSWANLAALLYAQGRGVEVPPLFERMHAANPGARAAQVAATAFEAFGERARAATWRRRAASAR
jgi:arylsulfatase A-like enzyme/predicted negative regulator of RcsB-dependent stress response